MIGDMTRVLYYVHNMQAVTEFYRDVLELKPIFDPKTAPTEWIEFNAGTVRIALETAFDPGGVASTHSKVVFKVDDVEKTREELIERGAELGDVMTSGVERYCEGKDPEGNGFRISER